MNSLERSGVNRPHLNENVLCCGPTAISSRLRMCVWSRCSTPLFNSIRMNIISCNRSFVEISKIKVNLLSVLFCKCNNSGSSDCRLNKRIFIHRTSRTNSTSSTSSTSRAGCTSLTSGADRPCVALLAFRSCRTNGTRVTLYSGNKSVSHKNL